MGDDSAEVLAGSFALADVEVKSCRPCDLQASQHCVGGSPICLPCRRGGRWQALLVALATPAVAYRPFDGTDAAVSDVNEVELVHR